jgi:hypothetical protein
MIWCGLTMPWNRDISRYSSLLELWARLERLVNDPASNEFEDYTGPSLAEQTLQTMLCQILGWQVALHEFRQLAM